MTTANVQNSGIKQGLNVAQMRKYIYQAYGDAESKDQKMDTDAVVKYLVENTDPGNLYKLFTNLLEKYIDDALACTTDIIASLYDHFADNDNDFGNDLLFYENDNLKKLLEKCLKTAKSKTDAKNEDINLFKKLLAEGTDEESEESTKEASKNFKLS